MPYILVNPQAITGIPQDSECGASTLAQLDPSIGICVLDTATDNRSLIASIYFRRTTGDPWEKVTRAGNDIIYMEVGVPLDPSEFDQQDFRDYSKTVVVDRIYIDSDSGWPYVDLTLYDYAFYTDTFTLVCEPRAGFDPNSSSLVDALVDASAKIVSWESELVGYGWSYVGMTTDWDSSANQYYINVHLRDLSASPSGVSVTAVPLAVIVPVVQLILTVAVVAAVIWYVGKIVDWAVNGRGSSLASTEGCDAECVRQALEDGLDSNIERLAGVCAEKYPSDTGAQVDCLSQLTNAYIDGTCAGLGAGCNKPAVPNAKSKINDCKAKYPSDPVKFKACMKLGLKPVVGDMVKADLGGIHCALSLPLVGCLVKQDTARKVFYGLALVAVGYGGYRAYKHHYGRR